MVSPLLKQTWVVSGILVNTVGLGIVVSYPASLLPGLRASDSDIQVDLETASWLASVIGFSTVIGFFQSSICMELWGRRRAHMLSLLPALAGWLITYKAGGVATLVLGRMLCGVTGGGTVTLGAIVIGEYTSPESRGTFLNLKAAGLMIGVTILHILAHSYHWRTVALLATIPYILALLNNLTWPESPSWLITQKQFVKSEAEFYYIRGRSEKSVKEFQALLRGQKDKISQRKSTFTETIVEIAKKFTEKDFVKPVAIIFASFFLLEASGRHYFGVYASDIMEGVTGNKSNAFIYTIFIDIITALSAITSSALVRIMKRRTLLFSSGIAALLVLVVASLYLYLSSSGMIVNDKPWIPLSMLVLYFVLANLGCTPIPLALLGEVYPLRHRAAGTFIGGIVMSVSLLVCLKITPYLLRSVDVYGTFAVHAVVSALSLLYLYYYLPETKDKTLQEIEDFFNENDNLKRDDEAHLEMLNHKT